MRLQLNLKNISYDRFEANEVKSVSDTLGFITKCAFNREILKHEVVSSLTEIVNLVRSEMKPSTKIQVFGH